MKKFLNFYIIFSCILFSTVLAIEPSIGKPLSVPPIGATYNPLSGIIQWICYTIACFAIIFAIIKFIKMLKSKKPIWKCILFVFIMIGISYLLAYFANLLPLLMKL